MLTVSSTSEVVVPTDEELNVELSGVVGFSDESFDKPIWSDNKAEAFFGDNVLILKEDSYATINNQNHSIDINKIKLQQPDDYNNYYFQLENKSSFPVYVSLSKNSFLSASKDNYHIFWMGTCTADSADAQAKVDSICQHFALGINVFDNGSNTDSLQDLYDGKYKIEANQSMYFYVIAAYSWLGPKTDEKFTIDFEPIEFEYSLFPKKS